MTSLVGFLVLLSAVLLARVARRGRCYRHDWLRPRATNGVLTYECGECGRVKRGALVTYGERAR